MAENQSFTQLFLSHKGKAIDKWEQYLHIYDREFSHLVSTGRPIRLLEIGVQNGGSLELWSKFLPEGSAIRGIDIDPHVSSLKFDSKQIRVDIADATDSNQLEDILGNEKFDIIVDDGSHVSDSVRHSFEIFFPHLSPGGRYVIEDLACSYNSHYGGGLKSAGSSIEFLKLLVDCLHRDYFSADSVNAESMNKILAYHPFLGRISFYDSIAVLEKLSFEKKQPYRRILGGDAAAIQPFCNWIPVTPTSEIQRLLFSNSAVNLCEQALFTEVDQRRTEIKVLLNRIDELSAEVEQLRASLNDSRLESDRRI